MSTQTVPNRPPDEARQATMRRITCVLGLVWLGMMTSGCATSPMATELPVGTVVASIDGVEFTARRVVAATHVHGVLAIAAQVDDGRTIHLTMLSPRGIAVVAVGAGEQNSAQTGYQISKWSSNLVGGSGTVTVTAFTSDHAEGSFSYTAVAAPGTPATGRRIVVGRFNVSFAFAN